MRYVLILFLCAGLGIAPASARSSERPNTVLVHPGDDVYVRFERQGRTLKLIGAAKEKDDQAQVILHLYTWDKKAGEIRFKIENKFDRELSYRVEVRFKSIKLHRETPVVPVVAEKIAFESWPVPAEELAVFAFELSK